MNKICIEELTQTECFQSLVEILTVSVAVLSMQDSPPSYGRVWLHLSVEGHICRGSGWSCGGSGYVPSGGSGDQTDCSELQRAHVCRRRPDYLKDLQERRAERSVQRISPHCPGCVHCL